MIRKERKFKTCKECGHREMISDEEYGCDNCGNPIDFDDPNEADYLRTQVFYHEKGHSESLHFCSWNCVFQKLRTIKTDDFISLPYLSFEIKNKKINAEGFWEAINRGK